MNISWTSQSKSLTLMSVGDVHFGLIKKKDGVYTGSFVMHMPISNLIFDDIDAAKEAMIACTCEWFNSARPEPTTPTITPTKPKTKSSTKKLNADDPILDISDTELFKKTGLFKLMSDALTDLGQASKIPKSDGKSKKAFIEYYNTLSHDEKVDFVSIVMHKNFKLFSVHWNLIQNRLSKII